MPPSNNERKSCAIRFGLQGSLTQTMEIARRFASGSTTRPEELLVLWVGEHLALIKFPGGTSWSSIGCQAYHSPWVVLIDVEGVGRQHGLPGNCHEVVWDCSRRKDGPLTKAKIAELIARVKPRDAEWLSTVAEREAVAKATSAKQSAIYGAETAVRETAQALLAAAKEGDDVALLGAAQRYRDALSRLKDAR